jgi:hypothetical protein
MRCGYLGQGNARARPSSSCHLSPACGGSRRRIRFANSWPNLNAHCRTVSWLTRMPRADSILPTQGSANPGLTFQAQHADPHSCLLGSFTTLEEAENPTVAIDGVFLKLVSAEEFDEVRRRLQIPLGTDLKYQQSRYQANAETIKGNATFEWRNGNKSSLCETAASSLQYGSASTSVRFPGGT